MMIRTLAKVGLGVLTLGVALFFVVAIMLSAPAAAQELPTNETQPDQPDDPTTEVHKTLGDLTIHSVNFESRDGGAVGLIEVTWHGSTPEQVTVTQLPTGGMFGGSSSDAVTISRNRVYPGERTELVVDLVSTDDPAILYTTQSLQNERAVRIEDNSGFLISDPWDSLDAQIAGLAGLLAGLLVTTAAAYKRTSRKSNDPERKL